MKMRSRLLIFLVLYLTTCLSVEISAQSITLQGKVLDEDMNPMELVTVAVVSQGKVTFTNLKGEYSMQISSADSVVVRYSMVGYKTKTRTLIRPKGKQTLQVQLFSDNNLGEVVVTETRRQTGQTQTINPKDIKNSPSASGNAVEELIQQQAGVSTHDEMSSQFNVRGGSFDENSVYVNNVEIHRPFLVRSGQQEGLSIINPDMVDKIQFSTGGYEAKYGDKMSSALDITYKRLKPKGSKKSAFEGNINASLLGAGIYIGLGTKHLSWLNSIRYKTNRYLLGSLETKGEYEPNFLDYQTYLSWSPNKRWTVDIIGNINESHYNFIPHDRETKFGTMENVKSFRVYFDGQEKDLFRTLFGTLNITRHITDNLHLSVIASAFHSREQECYDIQGQYWLTQTETSEQLGVGSYMEHTRNYLTADVQSIKAVLNSHNRHHDFEIGIGHRRELIKENSREYEMRDSAGYVVPHTGNDLNMIYTLNAKNRLKARRTEAYVQDTYKFSSAGEHTFFTLNYGIRFSHWSFNGESIVSPRVSLGIVPAYNHNVTFRIATGLYYQAPFFKELRDTNTVNGITYANLNSKIKSQRSIHFIGAFDYRFKMKNRQYKFSAEAYYKALGNLVPYSVNNVKVVYYGVNEASGHSMGLDLKLYGEFVPGTDSWISLSLMDTKMKLHGVSVPMPTDQRYGINLFFTDYFPGTDKWKMSLKLAYYDGLPFSTPHKGIENNTFRAPAYKRADIGMSFRALDNEKHDKKTFLKNIWIGIDCLNLFGINNVNSYYWITDITNQQYAVPNYLTGRQINGRLLIEF